MVAMPYEVLHF